MMMPRSPRGAVTRTFRSLRNPNYRLYWFGQLVSLTGTWMQRIAQAWLVLQLTHSPLALGTVTTIQFTPILCLSLFGGVLADRVPKRNFLVCTQSVMAVQALIFAFLVGSGRIQLFEVYILAGVLGLANAMDNPTRQAFVIELVGKDDLPNAVALNSTLFNTSRITGPAIGGVLIAAIGLAGCFYLNAASFLAVIGGLLLMDPSKFHAGRPARRGNALRQIGEGLRYAVTTPDIALVVLLMAVLGTFGYNFTVVLPLIAQDVLHTGAAGFGALTAAMGLGSLLAALGVAYHGKATRRALLLGATGFSLLLFAVAVSHWWLATIPLLVALGLFSITFTATANTRLQLVAPSHLRGRVMSIYQLLFAGTTPFGSLIIGGLAQRSGVQVAVAEVALVCLGGVAAALVYLRRAAPRLLPETEPGAPAEPASPAASSAPLPEPAREPVPARAVGGE
ncbi:MAG TPA: MFS transporter [Thermomicrobiales bacterium]|nr:MFS transporter [Thermomicrobiales bacterium]